MGRKTIKHVDLTQDDADYDDSRHKSIMSRSGEKVSFTVESKVIVPLAGVLGSAAFLHFIMGLATLTAVWVALVVVAALMVVAEKPELGKKILTALPKIRR